MSNEIKPSYTALRVSKTIVYHQLVTRCDWYHRFWLRGVYSSPTLEQICYATFCLSADIFFRCRSDVSGVLSMTDPIHMIPIGTGLASCLRPTALATADEALDYDVTWFALTVCEFTVFLSWPLRIPKFCLPRCFAPLRAVIHPERYTFLSEYFANTDRYMLEKQLCKLSSQHLPVAASSARSCSLAALASSRCDGRHFNRYLPISPHT